MTLGVHVAFNLIVNTVGSFLCALAFVYAVLAVFRIGATRGRLMLLLLPLVKVFWDLAAGIPAESFLWEKLQGAKQDLGSFRVGVGVSHHGLLLQAKLGARSGAHLYPQSAAELLDSMLSKTIGPWAPGAIVALCAAVTVVRLLARTWGLARFDRQTIRWRHTAEVLFTRPIGWRSARIYAAPDYAGVPFATGILHPYVILPANMLTTLSPQATQAVIEHELAHIAHGDPLLNALLSLVSDLFWYLPGLSGLLGRIRALLEMRADERAVVAGADGVALASALVAMGEMLVTAHPSTLGLFHKRRVLTQRVGLLLREGVDATSPRWGYGHWLGRAAILTLAISSILQAVFLGNYH